jgi:hypothetical protein
MPYITYRGTNASLMLHGIRFIANTPVLVQSESVTKLFRDRNDFDVEENKTVPIEEMTVPQLKEKAKLAGIEGFADMKKAELITALTGDDTPPADELNKKQGADGKNADSNNPPTA